MMKYYKYIFFPIAFALFGLVISLFIGDSYRITKFIEIGKFQNIYLIQPEELIMTLKNEEIQKMIYKHLDKNWEIKPEVVQKILANARFYRSKYIGFTAEEAKEEEASRIAELTSNAVAAYINEQFTRKMESIDSEIANLNLSIDTADNLIKSCKADSSCNQNQFRSMVVLYRNKLKDKRNEIEISLLDDQTFPSKTLSNMKEVYPKSREVKILIILIFSCIGMSLSLMQYLKKCNDIK